MHSNFLRELSKVENFVYQEKIRKIHESQILTIT